MKKKRCAITGKVCMSEQTAHKLAKKFTLTSVTGYMHAYSCMFCGKWHLTSQKQRI